MLVDAEGMALDNQKPSAETALHTSLYRLYAHVNAVLHVHSVAAVTLTRYLSAANEIVLQGYEMLKAFPGITTHDASISIRIYDNSQNIPALAQNITRALEGGSQIPAYLLRGHGAYAWGQDIEEAERIIEALEHLLYCEVESIRLRAGGGP